MKLSVYYTLCFCLWCTFSSVYAQLTFFAELTGNPVNTTGWNLTNNAYISNDEIILTPNQTDKSGQIFFQTPIDFSAGGKFVVDFDFRIFEGNAADGIALNVITQLPVSSGGWVGGGIGVPPSATGLKIIFDTYDNCSIGDNPEIQVFNGTGYYECSIPANHKVTNQHYLRSSTYQHARFIYDNGSVKVFINCQEKLNIPTTTDLIIANTGYFGFSSATGANKDRHSIKNVKMYTNTTSSTHTQAICSGIESPIGTNPIPNISYLWQGVSASDSMSFLSDPNASNPTFVMLNEGDTVASKNYLLSSFIPSTNGCMDTIIDTIKLLIYPGPKLDTVHIQDVSDCQQANGGVQAVVSGGILPYTYSWTKPNDPDLTIDSLIASNLQAGIYLFTITDSMGCSSSREITIEDAIPPSLTITSSANPICSGDSSLLSATVTGGVAPFLISWINGPHQTETYTVAPTSTSTYQAVALGANACLDTAEITIEVLPRPTANFIPQPITGCMPLSFEIKNLSTGDIDSSIWVISNEQDLYTSKQENISDFTHEINSHGCFNVLLTSIGTNGCVSNIQVNDLICAELCELHAPNVVSLSSSQGNNQWFVSSEGFDTFHCLILNRWGDVVYEYNDIHGSWNGRDSQGNVLPEGVYFYTITASLKGTEHQKQGFITLIY